MLLQQMSPNFDDRISETDLKNLTGRHYSENAKKIGWSSHEAAGELGKGHDVA